MHILHHIIVLSNGAKEYTTIYKIFFTNPQGTIVPLDANASTNQVEHCFMSV